MPSEAAVLSLNHTCSPDSEVKVLGQMREDYADILNLSALQFVAELHREFEDRRSGLLGQRITCQQHIDRGHLPDFLEGTREVRESDWAVASIPDDLMDRRVEITGPVDRKMIINALNSGANVYMADFEDSTSPQWSNIIEGQINLRDAISGTIDFTRTDGKHYQLNDKIATLMMRPRGWHLDERHIQVSGHPVSASLFDFGIFFYHNANTLIQRGSAPYFYLPKLESHLEARLWNDVFSFAQEYLGIPHGTIRATVLIENVLAAFEMDEILWELKEHSAGLNCGRWDYIFSFIKKFHNKPEYILPDRGQVTMDRHFLKSYVNLLISTCHRRGIHAIGGMAAQVPIKNDPEANEAALQKVRQDKVREVKAGHDGTWVAHPGLVSIARDVFDQHMTGQHQIHRRREDVCVTASDLLTVPDGTITGAGLRHNVNVGVQYLESWLDGAGCVPIYNLMEDAATAEICRSQLWQWVKHGAKLDDGHTVTAELVRQVVRDELENIKAARHGGMSPGGLPLAARILERLMTASHFGDWLTTTAYEYLD